MGCSWASLAASPLGQNSRMVIQNLQTTNPKAPGWGFHCIPKKWKPGHVSNNLPAWCIHCSHLQRALGRNHQEAEFRRSKGSTWGQIGTMTIQHQSWGRFMNFNGVFLVKWGNQGSLKVFGSLAGHGKPFPAVQGWIEEMPKSADRLKVWPQQRKPRKPSPPKSASLPNLVQTWIFDACFYMFLTALAFVSHFKPEKKSRREFGTFPLFKGCAAQFMVTLDPRDLKSRTITSSAMS